MIRPSFCKCPDFPCCGCGEELSQEEQKEQFEEMAALNDDGDDLEDQAPTDDDGMTDVEADADTLRSCGWGTDEDYMHDTPLGDFYGDGQDFDGGD